MRKIWLCQPPGTPPFAAAPQTHQAKPMLHRWPVFQYNWRSWQLAKVPDVTNNSKTCYILDSCHCSHNVRSFLCEAFAGAQLHRADGCWSLHRSMCVTSYALCTAVSASLRRYSTQPVSWPHIMSLNLYLSACLHRASPMHGDILFILICVNFNRCCSIFCDHPPQLFPSVLYIIMYYVLPSLVLVSFVSHLVMLFVIWDPWISLYSSFERCQLSLCLFVSVLGASSSVDFCTARSLFMFVCPFVESKSLVF